MGSKPNWTVDYWWLGLAYHKTGQYKKEKKLYKKAEQDFPNDSYIILRQAILALSEGDKKEASEYIDKDRSYLKEQSSSEANIANIIGNIHREAGIWDKAEEYYRQALSLEPKAFWPMHNLAYLLIDKDRNINEGMELVNKGLELNPENYNLLHTKGWGLYKQGKYKEALESLQKADSLKPIYIHDLFLHLEAAKKAVAFQKNN